MSTFTCPFCAEDISTAAVVCKHCGAQSINGEWSRPGVFVADAFELRSVARWRRRVFWLAVLVVLVGLGLVVRKGYVDADKSTKCYVDAVKIGSTPDC